MPFMLKEMTISVEEDVYNTLAPLVAQHRLDEYISTLIRSQPTQTVLEEAYKAMAADTEREREAQEWCNASFGPIGRGQ
jgi:predicted CopG family antitoxin